MKPHCLVWALALAGCSAPVTGPAPDPAPTATLRGLPSATVQPVFATALPTDTPLPTFTPLATATPLAYSVEKGDTLIGIAVEHAVSIEALEAANPGVDPNNLQIGQILFIPPPAGEPAPNQALLPTPLPIVIAPFSCAPSPVASLICLGEFVNTSDGPVANVSVKVSLPGADGTVVDSQVAYAPVVLIGPGQAVPLGVVFSGGSARTAPAVVVTADAGAAFVAHYGALDVSNLTGRADAAGFTLSATIANSKEGSLGEVTVVGTVYNAAGAVIGYRVLQLDRPLAAHTGTEIELSLPGVTSVARWAVIAQGRTP